MYSEEQISKMKKSELLKICEKIGILGCKYKNKPEIITHIFSNLKNKKKSIEKEEEKINDKICNISPLRYPGGKTRACKLLDKLILENFNINLFNTLISPFFGGGSFEFYFQNKYNYPLIVNDKFTPLYNFWNIIKNDKTALIKELNEILNVGVSKEDFSKIRKEILNLEDNPLKQATYYFVINRCSFSGSTLSGGFSEDSSKNRFTISSINKISNLNLTQVDLYNYDFKQFILSFHKDNCLMFLDPPYYLDKKSKLYGNNGDLHQNFDHQKLFQTIKDKKNWIMTYNNCDFIRDLYSAFTILEVDWTYGMNKSKNSSEIVIISK